MLGKVNCSLKMSRSADFLDLRRVTVTCLEEACQPVRMKKKGGNNLHFCLRRDMK